MKKIYKLLFLFFALVLGNMSAHAAYAAKVIVQSSPSDGGWVNVSNSSISSSSCTATSANNRQTKSGLSTSGNFTFYFCERTATGYTFKGWSTDQSSNSGEGASSNPFSKSIKGTTSLGSAGGSEYTYYAIFARMILSSGSTTRNLTTTLKTSVTDEVTISHVHAGIVSASISGDGYSVSLKSGSANSSTSSDVSTTFVVTYNPQTAGANQLGTLTIKSSNELSDIVINYSGTSNKYTQFVAWNESVVNVNLSKEESARDISSYVTITSEKSSPVLSFTSSNPTVIEVVNGVKLNPLKAGDSNITAHLAGDDEYETASSVAKTFKVSDRSTPKYTVNSTYNLLVGESFTVLSTSPLDMTCERVSGSTDGIYNYNNGTVTALKEGTVVLNFKQSTSDAWYSGESGNVTVNIARYATDLSVNTSAQTIFVGETYNPAFTTNNNEVTPVFTSSNPLVAIYEDGVIKALAAGTATLTFAQAEIDKWTGDSKTIDVTVNKHENPIVVRFDGNVLTNNSITLPFDATSAVSFEATNDVFSISESSNPAVATYADGTIHTSHNLGTVTFTVSQPETATHKAGQATFTVNVAYAGEVEGCTVLDKPEEKAIGAYDNKSGIEYTLDGPGKKLYVEIKKQSWGTKNLIIYGYDKNGSQITIKDYSNGELSDSYSLKELSISSNIVKIKFFADATLAKFFRNVRISRGNVLESAPMTFSENAFVGEPKTQNLSIFYSTTNGGDIKIVCDNPKFIVNQTSIATTGCTDATINVPVTYTSATVGTDVAHLIIYNSTNRIETTITASTIKKNQTLVWADNLSPMPVGKTHTDPASAAVPLSYEVISGTAVEVVDGNKIHALAVGSATVRAYNDGDDTWNPISDTKELVVTDLKVQRIDWMQSFTRLKTGGENIALDAKVYVVTNDGENEITELVNRPITYTSADESVVRVVNGNQLQIVGVGQTTLTATQAGDAEYIAAEAIRPVKVREPSAGCDMFVLEDASGRINTIDETVFDLAGEPESVSFDAWRTPIKVVIDYTGGDLYLSEFVNGEWSDALWSNETEKNTPTSYGPIALSRNATKIKFYTEVGATGHHDFSGVNVTLANYLEFTDTPDATAIDVDFPAAETQIGQTYTKTVDIRYSDIFDQLTVTHTNDKFTVTPTTIGEECGDHGTATITIQYHATVEGTEEDVITITDGKTTRTINVSATTQKNDQTITFAPAESMNTTDNVTLSATASSGLSVAFEQVSGEEFATVNAAGVVSVVKGGGSIVVRASQEGSALYNAAPSVEKTIYINKVTPTITTAPVVAAVTLPATLADAAINTSAAVVVDDKSAAVVGTFAWTDATTTLVAGTNSYEAIFTPENTNYYTTATCDLSVTASKLSQTITWSLVDNSEFNYFQTVPMDAAATSSLAVSYASSDESVAKIVAGAVQFIAPGIVTLTASQAGNATYEAAADVARTITIVKATPTITTIPNMVVFYEGHSLSESPIVGGVAEVEGNVVEGTFSWKEDATPDAGDHYTFPAIFTPNNTTFFNTVECMIPVRVTVYDRVFTDATGNHLWSDPLNWASGFVPEEVADATIDNVVIINTNVTIEELTIEENASVLVVENGSLTVGHSGASSTGNYGDLYVKDAATVTFNGDFDVANVYLSATLASVAGDSKSAQVSNSENLDIHGDVFFDVTLDPSGECSPGWYDFTVPFPVDALNGVYRIENGVETKVTNEVNYAIMSYHEDVRAQGKYGWKKFRGIMQPGVCYSITIDDVYPVYRFKKTSTGAFNTATTIPMTYTVGEGGAENQGWNCLGNGTLRHADLSASGISKVQVYDHASNGYTLVEINECSFVVGAAFFVQTPAAELMTLDEATNDVLRAPSREVMSEEHRLTLSRADGTMTDRLYLSATEEDKTGYVVGHDMAKFEVSNKTTQMWCDAYGAKLCDVELPLVNNQVVFDLSLSTPVAGDYVISADRSVNNETLYLMQDGVIVWNLTMSDYSLNLTKGTCSDYSILLVHQAPGVATDVEDITDNGTEVEKLMVNGRLYILRDSRLYDAQGRLVK